MANLVPLSGSSIIKQQKSPIVKSDKFLSSRIKSKSVIVGGSNNTYQSSGGGLVIIQKKLIKIDSLLKDFLILSKKESEKKRITGEQKEFSEREKELEKKKPPQFKGINLPSLPKMGFLDWIKNFITQTLLGFLAVRLIDYLPQLLKIFPVIIKVADFITDVGGKLLDRLITFVDWGYKGYDATKGFIKNTFGEDGVKKFDQLSGLLNQFLNLAIIAGLATAGSGGGGKGVKGGKPGTPGKPGTNRVGRIFGKGYTRATQRLAIKGLGKGGAKSVLRLTKPLVGRIPIIGGLIEFGLSWALGDPVGKAAFRGIGALLVGAVGTAIGGPFGAAIGGFAGGEIGGALYDMFFNNKKPQSKTAKAAGGGQPVTRGGQLVGGPAKRTIKKKKTPRTLRATPAKLKPGSAIGGEKKLKQLYPESKDKNKMSPFDFLKNSYEKFSRSTGLGSLAALAIKPIMGDKPSYADYKNAGMGVNNWMNQSIASGTLAYAGGGEVKMESIISGEDYSDVIAKALQDSIAPQTDKIIQDLMRQLMLKPGIEITPTMPMPTGPPGPAPTGGVLTIEQLVGLAKGAGFSDDDAVIMAAIAMAESGGNSAAHNKVPPDNSYGLWQINMIGNLGPERLRQFGISSNEQLFDPVTNAKAAYLIKKSQGFNAWTVHKTGSYKNHLQSARAAKGAPKLTTSPISATSTGTGGPIVSDPRGTKLAGDLGDFMKSWGGVPGSIWQHSRHGGRGTRSYPSFHNVDRAIDLGANANEQGPILRKIAEFNKLKGVQPVQLLHAGNDPKGGHNDHVHVAYAKGGKVHGFTRAILGEKGPEFVIDADSTAALEQNYPGFLSALNKANYKQALQVLQNYASYNNPTQMIMIERQVPVPVPIAMGGGGSSAFAAVVNRNSSPDTSVLNTIG